MTDLYTYLTEWAYQIYNHLVHDTLGMTPNEVYTNGLLRAGEREHRHIVYDVDEVARRVEFLMATRPSTPKGNALIQPGQGIKVNYIYYWNDTFRNPDVEKTKFPVRYDPFDMGVAYAYIEGRWVKCISQYYNIFAGRTEKEVLLASQEIRQKDKGNLVSTNISAKRLADFIASVQEHETLLLQRLRDLEAKGILSVLTLHHQVVSPKEPIIPNNQVKEIKGENEEQVILNENSQLLDVTRLPIFEEYK